MNSSLEVPSPEALSLDARRFNDLLADRRIITFFQPIVSIGRKNVPIVESLVRGIAEDGETLIPPGILFGAAKKHGMLLEFDRLCREEAAIAFATLRKNNPETLLSLNIETTIIDESILGSRHLHNSVLSAGVDCDCVILEIIESRIENTDVLREFTEYYRQSGFLIAIDDIGSGHSNFDRIPLLKPDLIKIDRALVQGVAADYHKQEVVKALTDLTHQLGGLVVAEGIEDENDALALHEIGVDFQQGFYFARPKAYNDNPAETPATSINAVSNKFKSLVKRLQSVRRYRERRNRELMERVVHCLEALEINEYMGALHKEAYNDESLECLYVTDENGVMITDTVFAPDAKRLRKKIFHPAPRGTDLSLKDYCLLLSMGLDTFTSSPYISQATGNVCITMSRRFTARDGSQRFLCCDILVGDHLAS